MDDLDGMKREMARILRDLYNSKKQHSKEKYEFEQSEILTEPSRPIISAKLFDSALIRPENSYKTRKHSLEISRYKFGPIAPLSHEFSPATDQELRELRNYRLSNPALNGRIIQDHEALTRIQDWAINSTNEKDRPSIETSSKRRLPRPHRRNSFDPKTSDFIEDYLHCAYKPFSD